MCRLLGVVGPGPLAADVLEAFAELAVTGNTPEGGPDARGHADGWGLAAFQDGALVDYARGLGAASRDPRFRERARSVAAAPGQGPSIAVAHLRRASPRMPVSARWSHPFVETRGGRTWAFAHNGGLPAFAFHEDVGLIDSQVLFRELLARLDGGDHAEVARAAKAVAGAARETYGGYSAINFLLTDGARLHAFREYAATPENEAYFTLVRGRAGPAVLVGSEPVRGIAATPIRKGALVTVAADGRIEATQVL